MTAFRFAIVSRAYHAGQRELTRDLSEHLGKAPAPQRAWRVWCSRRVGYFAATLPQNFTRPGGGVYTNLNPGVQNGTSGQGATMIKKALRRVLSNLLGPQVQEMSSPRVLLLLERLLLQHGKQAARRSREVDTLQRLCEAEFRVYSQWGEDGILEWLIERLPISSRRFIEFGVEDYTEANTRFLLINRNWKGLVMDGNPRHMQRVREEELYWRYDLTARCAFVDCGNINNLLAESGFSGNVGVLSIDVDGNDYWIWQAIEVAKADIVVCEYNAVFGDLHPITIPYTPEFNRTQAHHSNLYYGASISALCLLASRNGYELLGTNSAGNNAFFVREDLCSTIGPAIANKSPLPSLIRESRDVGGSLTFLSGLTRVREIQDLPVVRVDTGATTSLGALGPLYSQEWLAGMGIASAIA